MIKLLDLIKPLESIKSFLKIKIFAVIRNIKEKKRNKFRKKYQRFPALQIGLGPAKLFCIKKSCIKKLSCIMERPNLLMTSSNAGGKNSWVLPSEERCLLSPRGGWIFYVEKNSIEKVSILQHRKSFRNLIKSTWKQIVFNIFRLIWNQTDVCLVSNQSENDK